MLGGGGGGGGGLLPPPANYRAGSYSFIITNPTLAGERMLLIPKVSILSEQNTYTSSNICPQLLCGTLQCEN